MKGLTNGRTALTRYTGQRRVISDYEIKKVYERLRKRDYRLWGYSDPMHIAYVAGVRDALNEITE